jgi:hypothetical protein
MWMTCTGSVDRAKGCEDPESEHAALGTAAHELGEFCLNEEYDAWEQIGSVAYQAQGIEVDEDMTNAVQEYLDAIDLEHPDRHQGNSWVERRFWCPGIHELFYGTADFVFWDEDALTLHVWDYKHGAGIVVEVENNPQLMYYGCGVLEDLTLWGQVDTVVLHVAQPRGFHFDGPMREWSITTKELRAWLDNTLVPAMNKAQVSRETISGEHCRFCPARAYACPALIADMKELEQMTERLNEEGGAGELTEEELSHFMTLVKTAKIVNKAAEETAFNRMKAGKPVPGFKLVKARANRIHKDGAEKAAKEKFGAKAYTLPGIKSPAQIEKLPGGKAFNERWAYKPEKGMTVAAGKDSRTATNSDIKKRFKPVNKETENVK